MSLRNCKLGDHIELVERPNNDMRYGLDDVRGVNNLKLMIRTKADMTGRKLDKLQIVMPGEFFFNHRTSRNGSKFSITFNYDDQPHIVTEDYVVFRVCDDGVIDPMWLYMYFCRPEFDRYVIQNSWGSSTEFFNWDDICDVDISLPSYDVQARYAAVYKDMQFNQQCYERGLVDLKLVCDSVFDECKNVETVFALRDLVTNVDQRNSTMECHIAHGIRAGKGFVPSVASSDDLAKYKLVAPGQLACNLLHVGRDAVFPIAVNHGTHAVAVSPAYTVFEATGVAPADYIAAWFTRSEVGRYGWFVSDDNIRSGMAVARFFDMRIPVPTTAFMRSVVLMASVLRTRMLLNEQLEERLKTICPVLIKGSIDEGRR